MATFQTVLASLGTSESTVYTVPSGKSAIVKMLQVSNYTSTDYYVTVKVNDGTNSYYLANQANVPSAGAISLISGDLYLMQGYSIKATAQAASALHLIASVVEI